MIPATIIFDTGDGESPKQIESGVGCSPFVGMGYEFFDSDRDIELTGMVTEVVSRDLNGDVDLLIYVLAS